MEIGEISRNSFNFPSSSSKRHTSGSVFKVWRVPFSLEVGTGAGIDVASDLITFQRSDTQEGILFFTLDTKSQVGSQHSAPLLFEESSSI